ncbi:MAG: ParB N-terminal domain-containing protein [Alphaproteobacteria bacterium]
MMTNDEKYGLIPDFDWLPISSLKINGNYQRPADTKASEILINKITESFCWSKCQPLTVNDNGDNTYNVIDGQHRLLAARRLGDIESLPCWIIPSETVAVQAQNFVDINRNRVTANPFHIFYAELAAGAPEAVAVYELCTKLGIVISKNGATPNKPQITLALCFIKNNVQHPKPIAYGVNLIRQALPNKNGQLKADVLSFFKNFYLKFSKKAESETVRDCFITTLREFGDVSLISRQAQAAHATDKQPTSTHYSRILIEAYNRNFKKNQKQGARS